MRISSSVEYATRILLRLAGLPPGGSANAAALSEGENIPRDYVGQLLNRLRRANLVASRRGPQGGYHLSRPAAAITMGMVVRAVDQGVFEVVCDRYSEGEHACSHLDGCGIRPVWQKLGSLVEGFLDRVTLAQLLSPEPCVGSRVSLFLNPRSPARL